MNRAEQIIEILKERADDSTVYVRYSMKKGNFFITGGIRNGSHFNKKTFAQIESQLKATNHGNYGRIWVHPDSPHRAKHDDCDSGTSPRPVQPRRGRRC